MGGKLQGRLMDRPQAGRKVEGRWGRDKAAARTILPACGPVCHDDRRRDSNPWDPI